MRVTWAVLISMLVLVAAGCGSDGVGAGESAGAALLKPGALAYVEIDSDPESEQWKQVEELVLRFPDGEKWLAKLKQQVNGTDITWEDVHSTLGGDTSVAVYASSMTDVHVAALLHPDDVDEAMSMIERLNESEADDPLVARKVGDWIAASDKEESIDAALKAEGGDALADSDSFQEGMAELPDDALGRVYVDVASAFEIFGRNPQVLGMRMLGLGELDFAGAWAKARDDGAEIAGVLRGEGADTLLGASEEYQSKLLELVPADAFAFVTFMGTGIGEQVRALRANPMLGPAVEEFERESGVELADVLRLVDGEVAFYAAPGLPIPELTLLLEADDPEQSWNVGRALLRKLADVGEVSEGGGITSALFDGFAVHLAPVEGAIALSTSRPAVVELQTGHGDTLADSDPYQDALEAAGAPEQYTGLAWIDLQKSIGLILGYAGLSGESIPTEVSRNLEPLRSVVAYGEKEGDLAKSLLFVGIE